MQLAAGLPSFWSMRQNPAKSAVLVCCLNSIDEIIPKFTFSAIRLRHFRYTGTLHVESPTIHSDVSGFRSNQIVKYPGSLLLN